jgi:hypothetical protein
LARLEKALEARLPDEIRNNLMIADFMFLMAAGVGI